MTAWIVLACVSLAAAHQQSGRPAAGVMLTQADALKAAFPRGFTRRTLLLEPEQAARIEALTEVPLSSAMVIAYGDEAEPARLAFFERAQAGRSHVTVMTTVAADGSLESVRLLASDLPVEALPPAEWLARLRGQRGPRIPWSSVGLRSHHDALAAGEAVLGAAQRALAVCLASKEAARQ